MSFWLQKHSYEITKKNKTKQNKTKQNKTKQNKTKQNKTKQNKTKQNKTKQKQKQKTKIDGYKALIWIPCWSNIFVLFKTPRF